MEQTFDPTALPVLPFVGRVAELERLVGFWRGTLEADEMRGALLVGEAGIGKSRLVNELLPRIGAAGGVTVHVRLVPESATAIVPLLVQGLWYSETARPLLHGEVEADLSAAISALRRLARLRPTLVVIEDLHLLAGDALRHLVLMIDALAEESLALLATSRPVELPARAAVERVLLETIRLDGLDAPSIAELWERLFGLASEPEIVEGLGAATAGNPLALRSALRSALRAGFVTRQAAGSGWRVKPDVRGFTGALRRSVDLLSEGMAAHLADEHLRAAIDLAMLGEVFAPETATMILEERSDLLDALLLDGIIVRATTSLESITASRSQSVPLAFTHTLLHQHLISGGASLPARLTSIVASGAPLYSIVPFRMLAAEGRLDEASAEDLRRAIDRIATISFRLDAGPDWRLAEVVLAAGWRILEGLDGRMGAGELLRLRLRLLARTLAMGRHAVDGESYAARLDEMLALTSGGLPPELLGYRLRALYHLHVRCAETDRARCDAVWEQVEDLCAAHPELRRESIYLDYLDDVARAALRGPDMAMLRRVELIFEQLLTDPDLPDAIRAAARRSIASSFLLLFDSSAELDRRMALLDELPTEVTGDNASVVINRMLLLETTGRMEEGLAAARAAEKQLAAIGLLRNAAHCRLIAICCHAAIGAEPEVVDRELERLLAGDGYVTTPVFRRNVAIYLTEITLLRGELEWTRRLQRSLQPESDLFWSAGRILLAVEEGSLAVTLDGIELDDELRPLGTLAAAIVAASNGAATIAGDARAAARMLLDRPLLRMEDLLVLHAVLTLLAASPKDTLDDALRATAQRTLAEALIWVLDRRLLPLAHALIVRYGEILPRVELAAANDRLKRLEERRRARQRQEKQDRTIVRMIGTVTTTLPGGEPVPMRGFRMKTVLALLVGARMMKEPLTHRDFCRLAADGELDPDLARKTTNMAVIRLREAIGAEAVVSGEETYELDMNHVQVDLLDAWEQIDAARGALQRRSLARAVPALLRAIGIVNGDVPFPGLYDDFFDALRDDLDFRLRTMVIDVARALLREADVAGAEALLRRALQGLPGDEEIGELLRTARESGGMRAAATMIATDV